MKERSQQERTAMSLEALKNRSTDQLCRLDWHLNPERPLKAVVMDLDGTLLNSENKITPLTRHVLKALEEQGVQLVLASGRSYTRLLNYAKELDMPAHGGWLIEIDGVAVYDTANESRRKFRMMDPAEIRDVFAWLTLQKAESQAMFDDGLFDFIPEDKWELKKQLRKQMQVDEKFPWTAGPWSWLTDFRDGYPNITYIQSADQITRPVNKIQIMDEEEPLMELFERLQNAFGDAFSIYRTTPRQLEILPLGYSKGKALRQLMEDRGWSAENTAVFGDGENDVSLFEQSHLSFAMDNARPYVKEKAEYTAGDHDQDGIVQGLVSAGLLFCGKKEPDQKA